MTTSFSFKNNVQVVKFSGAFLAEETSQVLAKFEEKIRQDRKLFLFHLEEFQNQDDISRAKIIHLIKFCMQKNLSTTICLPQKFWTLYSTTSTKMFNTEAEALVYLENLQGSKETPALSLEQQKEKETDELMKKYEVFHRADELDPYHLKNMNRIYPQAPTIEAIENLEKAKIDIERRKENIARLEIQAEEMAKEAFELSLGRNQAIKENEFILLKQKTRERELRLESQQKLYLEKIVNLRQELSGAEELLAKTKK